MSTSFIHNSLQKYLERDDDRQLRKFCKSLHPQDLANSLKRVSSRDAARVLDRLEPDCSSRVLTHMDPRDQEDTVSQLPEKTLDQIIMVVARHGQLVPGSREPQVLGPRLLHTLSLAGRRKNSRFRSGREEAAQVF